MTNNRPNPDPHPIRPPALSDEAVVQICNFMEHVFDQFDLHYSAQVRRFYEDRAQHNVLRPWQSTGVDDPPF